MTQPRQLHLALRMWQASAVLHLVMTALTFGLGITKSWGLTAFAIGVINALVGVAIWMLGTRSFAGDVRSRSALAILTMVWTFMNLVTTVLMLFLLSPLYLLASLAGLVGSMLAYRPASEEWFSQNGQS